MGGSGELLYLPAAILPLRSYHGPASLHTPPAASPPLDCVATGATAATAANSRTNVIPAFPPKPNSGAARFQHPPISVKHLCQWKDVEFVAQLILWTPFQLHRQFAALDWIANCLVQLS